jgi:hypothetical protein
VVGVQDEEQVERLDHLGVEVVLVAGTPKVIRRKFSTSERLLSG